MLKSRDDPPAGGATGNEALIEHLVTSGVLKTPALMDAFYAVDREEFSGFVFVPLIT